VCVCVCVCVCRYVGAWVRDLMRLRCHNDNKSNASACACAHVHFALVFVVTSVFFWQIDVLDIVPTSLHQRCSIFLGSKLDVDEADTYHGRHIDCINGN
jgi:hypothetical protein